MLSPISTSMVNAWDSDPWVLSHLPCLPRLSSQGWRPNEPPQSGRGCSQLEHATPWCVWGGPFWASLEEGIKGLVLTQEVEVAAPKPVPCWSVPTVWTFFHQELTCLYDPAQNPAMTPQCPQDAALTPLQPSNPAWSGPMPLHPPGILPPPSLCLSLSPSTSPFLPQGFCSCSFHCLDHTLIPYFSSDQILHILQVSVQKPVPHEWMV